MRTWVCSLMVAALAACGPGSRYDDTPAPITTQGRITVVNQGVDILVVAEIPYGRKRVSVYPGEKRSWVLMGGTGTRQLAVQVGSATYYSGVFVADAGRCFELVVDTTPRLTIPVGPWPRKCVP